MRRYRILLLITVLTSAVRLFAQNPVDFLSAIDQAVKAKDGGKYDGKLYEHTYNNSLPPGWLHQTPNVWGKLPADVVPWHHSKQLATSIGDIIATAQHEVDIVTLAPPPDGWWAGEIVRGLTAVAHSHRRVTVRILVGNWFTGPNFHAEQYLMGLRDHLNGIYGGKLTIYAAGQRTSPIHSWNHAKIVEVDGKHVITGGHNQWPFDYLGEYPVHDVSMQVDGPAAYSAFSFANVLWDHVAWCYANATKCPIENYSYYWKSGGGEVRRGVPPSITLNRSPGTGSVPMVAVARGAVGLLPGGTDLNPSDTAMLAVFDHARTSIRLSQQDIALSKCGDIWRTYWPNGMDSLGRAIARGVDVQIVLSGYRAYAGKGDGLPYSTCVGNDEVWRQFRPIVERASKLHGKELNALMKSKLHIASLRFGAASTWNNAAKWPFANHAKVIIADDSVFYIGSSNLYPTDLQEFGYFVQYPSAVKTLLEQYWNPMWQYSRVTEYQP